MNEGSPVISVVVPTKGRLASLERCLETLAANEYPRGRFEVVIANDRGGAEVDALVASFADRLCGVTTSPERTGPSAARNAGAAAAGGRFVAFTDDDCEPSPGWLSALERALEANPGAAVGGEVRNGVPQNVGAVATQLVVDALHGEWNRDPDSPRFFASSNVAFPLDGFRAIGGFDEDFRYAEDRELCERWLRTGHRFAHAPNAVVIHMRSLDLWDFVKQHYGYGRGAYAFHHFRGSSDQLESSGVLRKLAGEALRRQGDHGRIAVGAYAIVSQIATTAGFMREAAASVGSTPVD